MKAHRLLLLLLIGCTAEGQPPPPDKPVVDAGPALDGGINEDYFDDDWTTQQSTDAGTGNVQQVEQIVCREPRRVSVEQLKNTMPRLFDGGSWFIGTTTIDLFDFAATTLGAADYITVNSDNLEPTPTFMKFMDNMASRVCLDALFHDDATMVEEDKILVRYTDPDENLRWMRLRYHNIYVPPGSTEGITEYRAMYDDMVTNNPFPGTEFPWFGVCVAMLTAPEFYVY